MQKTQEVLDGNIQGKWIAEHSVYCALRRQRCSQENSLQFLWQATNFWLQRCFSKTTQSPPRATHLLLGPCIDYNHRGRTPKTNCERFPLLWVTFTLKTSLAKLLPQRAKGIRKSAHLCWISPLPYLTFASLSLFPLWKLNSVVTDVENKPMGNQGGKERGRDKLGNGDWHIHTSIYRINT